MNNVVRLLGSLSIVMLLAGCAAADPVGDGAATDEARGNACLSTADCRTGQYCTTEDGVCNRPPGCRPGDVCIAACAGTCRRDRRERCGETTCGAGQVCCNASCGICTEPGGFCTQQVCEPVPLPGACQVDSDCRLFDDYCTGCDCRALSTSEPDPVCDGPGVRCFAQPCMNHVARCVNGSCQVQ